MLSAAAAREKNGFKNNYFTLGSGAFFHMSIFHILYNISITAFYVYCWFSQNKNVIKFHNDWLLTQLTPTNLHITPPQKEKRNSQLLKQKIQFLHTQKTLQNSKKPNSWWSLFCNSCLQTQSNPNPFFCEFLHQPQIFQDYAIHMCKQLYLRVGNSYF